MSKDMMRDKSCVKDRTDRYTTRGISERQNLHELSLDTWRIYSARDISPRASLRPTRPRRARNREIGPFRTCVECHAAYVSAYRDHREQKKNGGGPKTTAIHGSCRLAGWLQERKVGWTAACTGRQREEEEGGLLD
ncbi:hypothetical protein GWI33_017240 [Rhynchophorus ferrugineus]|uniref:Uncharacterized protein n=1 Tax=Rhynchophorus ferrugineus TaxID=354439 RepID=A0A834HZH9_RHYFE|nr:hypothetical protein GWI33_017240 [Rhynchophorus ferrugineus]